MSVEEVKVTLLHCGKTNRCEGCPFRESGMRCINKAINSAFEAILELEARVDSLTKSVEEMHKDRR